jgi:hypothetical protein
VQSVPHELEEGRGSGLDKGDNASLDVNDPSIKFGLVPNEERLEVRVIDVGRTLRLPSAFVTMTDYDIDQPRIGEGKDTEETRI